VLEREGGDMVKWFPLAGLPRDPKERFNLLFNEREKWKFEDIVVYLG